MAAYAAQTRLYDDRQSPANQCVIEKFACSLRETTANGGLFMERHSPQR